MSGTHAHLLILESDCKKIYRIMITPSNKGLFNVLLRLVQPSWRVLKVPVPYWVWFAS